MSKRILAALGAALILVSCGGGGGGGSPSASSGDDRRSDAQSADPEMTRMAGVRASTSLPAFGSVTQSSNRGRDGVTEDAASTSFDGRHVRLTVRRNDGSRLALNGEMHRIDSDTGTSTIPGHSTFLLDGLLRETSTSFSLAAVYVSWDNTDPTDYLAGGYWMHAEGDIDSGTVTRAEIGAFVDGPELSGTPTLRNLGTATYTGGAAGFYTYRLGAAQAGIPSETIETGEFGADASLTADFAAETISGCIGCNGGVAVSGVGVTPSGEIYTVSNVVPVRVRLGATPFENSGSFRGTQVSMEIPGTTVTRTVGSWGGRFSTIPDADGNPRVVAGTAGADWREADGSQGTFVGAWYGATER